MSKSRGTGISPLRYLDIGMNPEWLRYYIAAKLNSNVEDIDFNPDDFIARVNSDLVGKYVNIASRAANFISKHFGGQLGFSGDTELLVREARGIAAAVAMHYEARELGTTLTPTSPGCSPRTRQIGLSCRTSARVHCRGSAC
jgi:methionyl-tRNA synthetase